MAGYGGKDGAYGGEKPAESYGIETTPPVEPYGIETTPPDLPGRHVPYPDPKALPYPPPDPPGPHVPYPDPKASPYPPPVPTPAVYLGTGSSTYPPPVVPYPGTDPSTYPPPVVPYQPVPYPPDPAKLAEAISNLTEKLSAADSKLGGAAGQKRDVEDAIKMYQEGLLAAGLAKSEFPDSEGLKALVNQFTTGLEAARAKLVEGDSPSRSPKPVLCACALEHFECAKCFAPLHSKPLSVFIGSDGKRSCKHFIHTQCCDAASMKTCPTCDVPFAALKPLPCVIDDTKSWFAAVDTDGNGTLDKEEAFAALASSLPSAPGTLDKTSTEILKKKVEEKWKQWDPNGDGKISCVEVMIAGSGLRDFVVAKLKEAAPEPDSVYALPPPQLPNQLSEADMEEHESAEYKTYQAQKEAWYQHWDKDKNKFLDKEEVARAIVKTFDLSSAKGYSDVALLTTVENIRQHLADVWCIWDSNGDNVIDLEEFIMEEGLGDSLIASLPFLLKRS